MEHVKLGITAQEEGGVDLGLATLRVCLLSLCGGVYAVDLRYVREVIPLEHVTHVPGMPAILLGVTNVRGSVLPLIDVRLMLGLPPTEITPLFIAVLRQEELHIGVLVDRAPEIVTVLLDQFFSAPASIGQGKDAFLSGVVRVEDQSYQTLDVPSIVMSVEEEETGVE